MAERPKLPPTSGQDPYRNTRPRKAPPPPSASRTRAAPLDDKRAELVRAYVAGEAIPSESPESAPPEGESEPPYMGVPIVPADVARASRTVEIGPDQTIRPRRSWPRAVKDWAETLGHAQKIVLAVIALGGALTAAVTAVYHGGHAVYTWYATRPSAQDLDDKFKACADLVKSKAEKADLATLQAEVADAGTLAGDNWDKQDEINRTVHKDLNRLRPRVPPASMGPKAKGEGRH